jgi:protein-S-isoprenylcysteine O-methyltransferase Ste14
MQPRMARGASVSRLELKVPPDVVWVIVAGLMWLVSTKTPRVEIPSTFRGGLAVVLTVAGVALMAGARAALVRAETTWRPMTPGQTTRLVSSGVYSVSRNPIYLGMLLVMFGWAVLLNSPGALVVSAAFVAYLDRFQIRPEERALTGILGQEYVEYRKRVRRWV